MDPVFIHVPRTGGNSLFAYLKDKNIPLVNHTKKHDLSQFKDNWVFAFVRDPVDRAISAYAYLNNGGGSEEDNRDADKYVRPFPSFVDFVFLGLERASAEQRHFLPQRYWLTDEQGKVVASFLGRTERLQQDFDHVCELCGWEPVKLDTLNSSNRDGLGCTPLMMEVIQRIYAEDYNLIKHELHLTN